MHDCHLSAGSGWAGSYQNYKSLLKIDYILCSKSLSPMDYEVITNRWSDHKIQLATIKAEEK
jgi:endonuclease/exonuclease/phosphatase family metal-dependent hydrolase